MKLFVYASQLPPGASSIEILFTRLAPFGTVPFNLSMMLYASDAFTAVQVNVYADWNDDTPTGQRNTVSFVNTTADTYEVFFNVTGGQTNVDVRFSDATGYRSWAINVDDSGAQIDGGDQITYDATTVVSGDTPLTTADRIIIVNATGTTFAVGIPNLVSTDGTYRIYVKNHGDAGTKFNATTGGFAGTVELSRDSDNDLASDETFHVGKVSGDVHANLKNGADDLIDIFADRACTATQLSSETENPTDGATPDYTQYFEADATNPTTTDYHIKASMISGGTYSAVG
ncbi:unnamed protein product, partial [marine sediment metagenome]